MQCPLVNIRIDCNRLDTHFLTGIDHPHSYLASIGYQDFLDHDDILLTTLDDFRL